MQNWNFLVYQKVYIAFPKFHHLIYVLRSIIIHTQGYLNWIIHPSWSDPTNYAWNQELTGVGKKKNDAYSQWDGYLTYEWRVDKNILLSPSNVGSTLKDRNGWGADMLVCCVWAWTWTWLWYMCWSPVALANSTVRCNLGSIYNSFARPFSSFPFSISRKTNLKYDSDRQNNRIIKEKWVCNNYCTMNPSSMLVKKENESI